MADGIGAPERRREAGQDAGTLGLRPKDAAKLLGIGERKLWELTNRGDIPHLKLGRCTVYPRHLLIRWLEDKTKGGRR